MPDDYPVGGPGNAQGAAAAPAKAEDQARPQEDREQLIAELRRRYLEGSYQVEAEAVSSKIVERHLAK